MCWAHARRKFFEQKDLAPASTGAVLERINPTLHVLSNMIGELSVNKLAFSRKSHLKEYGS